MSRAVIGSRAELIAALRKQAAAAAAPGAAPCHADGCRCAIQALLERARALAQGLFLDALFIVAQFPGGQIPEAAKCCYAFDVRRCDALCRAARAEEVFWCGLARVQHPRSKRTRLMHAAHRGDAERVRWLLARGAPQEARCLGGWTALFFASDGGHVDAVRVLLAAGAEAGAVNGALGSTPLHNAATTGHAGVVEALIEAGADVNAARASGATPLHCAAERGHADAVRALLKAGASVDARQADGATPLIKAATHAPVVRALLEAGANVNAVNTLGITPLMVAAGGHIDCGIDAAHALLAAGAGVNVANFTNTTALMFASGSRSPEIVRALLLHGASTSAANNRGKRALHHAVDSINSDPRTAALLLFLNKPGADLNARDADGKTALGCAVTAGMKSLLKSCGGVM